MASTQLFDVVADAQKQWIEGSFALANQILALQKSYALAVADAFGAAAKTGAKQTT
jgi:hypothetical protein